MCVFSAPKVSRPPAPVPAPAPVPTPRDPQVVKARSREKQVAALAQGRDSTILTSGLGLTTRANGAKKTVLGA